MHISDWISLQHLDRMTDSTGLVQHAIYSRPRRESGYTTDDNARALRLCARLWTAQGDQRMLQRISTYLSFLQFAHCPGRGFHNFMSYQRYWLDAEGCGDCQGQAVRGLAEVLGSTLPGDFRKLSRELIKSVLPFLADLRSIRAQAYIVLAWGHLWSTETEDIAPLESIAWFAAQRLMECYDRSQRPDWPWFESHMTYANGVIPQALFAAAKRWPKEEFLEVAQTSFDFLDRETTANDLFWPVGNSGWYPHREDKALYDQQPVEAVCMAETALAAYDLLQDQKYLATFHRAHAWFHGQNSAHLALVDVPAGSCYDGLHADGVNRNQGAESTLAYLWTEMQHLDLQQSLGHTARDSIAS
jgi:hypothetical protein